METDYLSEPPPHEPLGTRGFGVGTVKRWRDEKGVGCISCDQTAPWDIWVHWAMIDMEGYKVLREGQQVEIEYERADQDSFRYRAVRVRPL